MEMQVKNDWPPDCKVSIIFAEVDFSLAAHILGKFLATVCKRQTSEEHSVYFLFESSHANIDGIVVPYKSRIFFLGEGVCNLQFEVPSRFGVQVAGEIMDRYIENIVKLPQAGSA